MSSYKQMPNNHINTGHYVPSDLSRVAASAGYVCR